MTFGPPTYWGLLGLYPNLQVNMLLHWQSQSLQVQYLGENKDNTGLVVAIEEPIPRQWQALSHTWEKAKENTVLVVALPRTYSLPVTNTLSFCCQLQ